MSTFSEAPYWERWLADRTPHKSDYSEIDEQGLLELKGLYSRSFEAPYLAAAERERMEHLASHLRQRITLNPGPSGTGSKDDPWRQYEAKAREILASIALNPDAHHWSYVAATIHDAVQEASGKEPE